MTLGRVMRIRRLDGFSQRHVVNPGVSRYLQALDKGFNYWRSPVTANAIRNDVLSFKNSYAGTDIPPLLRTAIGRAYRAFRLPEPVKMLHLNDVFDYDLQIWSRSPGLPWKSLGYKTKRDVVTDPRATKSIRWFWHRIKNGESINAPDCCAFVRSHLAEPPEAKVRAVWGYPMTLTMGEAVFAVPLIEAYQKHLSPIAYGYETAVGGTRRLVTEMQGAGYYGAIDFSSFDKTVPACLIDAAFDILESNLDFVNYRHHGIADARKTVLMFDYIKDYFIRTPIRLCNGERYRKFSGVASGSYFTQLIDSVVNYILITWMCLEVLGDLPSYIKVLGDDSIFRVSRHFCLDDFADLAESIGMKINVAKSVVSRNPSNLTFLGYQLNDGTPSKPFERWMAALLYPEYPDRAWDDVASRALGLLYANLGVDSQFDTLCRRIIVLQPFDLHFSANIVRMLRMIGWNHVDRRPPDMMYFMRRLKVL